MRLAEVWMSERATEPGSRFSFAAMVDSSSWNGVLLTKSTKKGALKTILPLYEKAQPQLAGFAKLGDELMIEEGAYRYVSWPSWPMLLLSVPCRLTLDSLLQKPETSMARFQRKAIT
uniref:Uncharacterized protein n=1 Tax=Oryza glumipatula TaxID=40148 RepID=A0A0E0A0W1_9ORYZ